VAYIASVAFEGGLVIVQVCETIHLVLVSEAQVPPIITILHVLEHFVTLSIRLENDWVNFIVDLLSEVR